MNDIQSKIKAVEAANGCIDTDLEGFRRFLKANPEAIAWNWAEKVGWYWDSDDERVRGVDTTGNLLPFDEAFGVDCEFKFIPCDDELLVHVTEGTQIVTVLNILVNAVGYAGFNFVKEVNRLAEKDRVMSEMRGE